MNTLPIPPVSFIADCTLGKLARLLRLAGFDTLYDTKPPDAGRLVHRAGRDRIVLTRSKTVAATLPTERTIAIQNDHARRQIRQVFATLALDASDLRPLSRCSLCNQLLVTMSRQDAYGRVPAYVWQQHQTFRHCPTCRRIYWSGSHVRHLMAEITNWGPRDRKD